MRRFVQDVALAVEHVAGGDDDALVGRRRLRRKRNRQSVDKEASKRVPKQFR